jgi:hypothetical protein
MFLLEKLDCDLLLEEGSSKIQELFQGSMCFHRKCKVCGRVHQKEDVFRTLDLSLIDATANTSVSNLLSLYTSIKDDGNQSRCDNCLEDVDTETHIDITQYPKVIFICLKRYSPVKNDVAIKFDSVNISDENEYQLKSFVSHFGDTPTAGHYFATISFGGIFLELNDEIISVCDEIISSSDCYLVVYQKSVKDDSIFQAESHWIDDFKRNSTVRTLQRSDTLPIIPEFQTIIKGLDRFSSIDTIKMLSQKSINDGLSSNSLNRLKSSETIHPFSQKSIDKQSSIENFSQENRDASVGRWYEEEGWEDEDIDYNQFWEDYHHLDLEVSVSDIIFPPKTVLIL